MVHPHSRQVFPPSLTLSGKLSQTNQSVSSWCLLIQSIHNSNRLSHKLQKNRVFWSGSRSSLWKHHEGKGRTVLALNYIYYVFQVLISFSQGPQFQCCGENLCSSEAEKCFWSWSCDTVFPFVSSMLQSSSSNPASFTNLSVLASQGRTWAGSGQSLNSGILKVWTFGQAWSHARSASQGREARFCSVTFLEAWG